MAEMGIAAKLFAVLVLFIRAGFAVVAYFQSRRETVIRKEEMPEADWAGPSTGGKTIDLDEEWVDEQW